MPISISKLLTGPCTLNMNMNRRVSAELDVKVGRNSKLRNSLRPIMFELSTYARISANSVWMGTTTAENVKLFLIAVIAI
jgi:hypothetical protein